MFSTRLRFILAGLAFGAILLGAVACSSAPASSKSSSTGGGDEFGKPNGGSADLSRDAGVGAAPAASGELAAPGSHDSAQIPAGDASSSDPALQGLLDRKIVQNTSVDVGVKDVGRAFTDIISAAQTAGGFVAGSAFSNVDDKPVADLTVRVPADRYQDILAKVRGMGEVSNETSEANDVTEEYTDLQARLRTLAATEQRYLDLLAKAETINDILTVQDRLDSVRGQIEQVQGRVNLLDHLTDLATITVHLRPAGVVVEPPPPDGGPHPLAAAENAWEASLKALRGLAAAALAVAAFSWWLVPPAIVAVFSTRWWRNRKSRTPASGAA